MISIIVPVYNVARWLDECISSVLRQTYTNWELLLIDDGSTDASPILCDNYAATDKRIRVVHQPNAGLSAARNTGLNMAQGEYVMFLDSDDYWYKDDTLERLRSVSEKQNADVVRGEYKAVDSLGNDLFCRPVPSESLPYVNRLLTSGEYAKYAMHGENFVVLSLYRRKCFEHIRFKEGRIFEDMEFNARLYLIPWRCVYVPDIRFYAYRKLSKSLSNQGNPKALEGSFSMCDEYAAFSEQADECLLKDYYRYYSVMMYIWTLRTLSENPYYSHRARYIDDLQLKRLHHRTFRRMFRWGVFNKLSFFALLPIKIAVWLSRMQLQVVLTLRKH